MKEKEKLKTARISDSAVQSKTGENWEGWFSILDSAGAKKMSHKEIVAYLGKKYKSLGAWWRQMIAVTYEQARGLRERYQTPAGYEISVSRTIPVPTSVLFKAWHDEKLRKAWFPGAKIVIRKATPNKSMRITWVQDNTNLDVNFYPRGENKCQVAVQHTKLPDKKAASKMKIFWSDTLDRLKETLLA